MRGSYNRPITHRYHAAKESLHCTVAGCRLQATLFFFPLLYMYVIPECRVQSGGRIATNSGQWCVEGGGKHVE